MRAKEITPSKLVIFDIDDTLVHTQTKVHVVKDGEIINSLNSHDFTHYRLQPGEEFDFSGFRNAREFFEKSKPIIPMMNQLKRDIATGNKVVMVTARADFDDKELFLDTFRKYGVDIDKVHVYRAGNSKQGTTEERKKLIIKNLLDRGDYSKAIMYDDAKPNLHSFMELKKEYPKTRFYAWHVSLEGVASEYMREDLVSERRRRRKRARWAAWGPGPYGGYGYATGYSGSSADGGVSEELDKPTPSVENLAKKHNVSVEYIKSQLQQGIEIEQEHTSDKSIAKEIALDHLNERPDYYKKLKKIESIQENILLDEGWKDLLAHIGVIGALAGIGTTSLTVKQALERPDISDTKKAAIAIKADIPPAQLPKTIAAKIPDAKELLDKLPKKEPEIKKSDQKSFKVIALTSNPNELMLKTYAMSQGIKGVELAAFLAQCAHESNNFNDLVEKASGRDYDPVFQKDKKTGKIIIDPKTKKPKNFNSTAARLGNTQPGDGVKFKGRGFIQLTGRDNYRIASYAVFGDDRLLKNPSLAENPKIAAIIAVWFWEDRVKPKVNDFQNVKAVTHPINSGLKGIEKREKYFGNYMQAAVRS